MTVTTDEAARLAGVSPATVRQWVVRGWLTPARRGAKPLRFHPEDVWRCARDRMNAPESRRLDTLAERWRGHPDDELSR